MAKNIERSKSLEITISRIIIYIILLIVAIYFLIPFFIMFLTSMIYEPEI